MVKGFVELLGSLQSLLQLLRLPLQVLKLKNVGQEHVEFDGDLLQMVGDLEESRVLYEGEVGFSYRFLGRVDYEVLSHFDFASFPGTN